MCVSHGNAVKLSLQLGAAERGKHPSYWIRSKNPKAWLCDLIVKVQSKSKQLL